MLVGTGGNQSGEFESWWNLCPWCSGLLQDDVEGRGGSGQDQERGLGWRDQVSEQLNFLLIWALEEREETTEGDILKPENIGLAGITHSSSFDPRCSENPEAEA
jgi:hypothetical protein